MLQAAREVEKESEKVVSKIKLFWGRTASTPFAELTEYNVRLTVVRIELGLGRLIIN